MGYCDAGTVVTDESELGLGAGDECSCLDTRWGCVNLEDGSCSGSGWNSGDLENTPERCFTVSMKAWCDAGVIATDASQLAVEEEVTEEEATEEEATAVEYLPVVIAVQTASYGNEFSWEITSSDEVVCSGGPYDSHAVYEVLDCDLDDGSYVLNCIDTFGDGWHGATVTINGVAYCGEFLSGTGEDPGRLMTAAFTV